MRDQTITIHELKQKLDALVELAGRPKRTDKNDCQDWVILFTSENGADDWQTFHGTKAEARAEATRDHNHTNYGRNGFRLLPDVKDGPDAKHPHWEKDDEDEAYTALRDGCFCSWEEFARFVFESNKELRDKRQ